MEWKEVRLGDIVSIKSGLAYKGVHLGKGENILLGMGCVSFKDKFIEAGARLYEVDAKEQYCVKVGDIVLATRQQSDNLPILAMPAIIPDTFYAKQIIFGTNLYKVDNTSDVDNKYLFWQLKTPHYINYISSVKTGSVVRMVTKKNVEDYVFRCPPKETRDKISNFLWSLDRKIELNNKINAQLEEMAQAIFKSWFVDFEPFKDGKFVDSELGLIPEGWRVGTLKEIASVTSGKRPPMKQKEHTENITVPLIGAADVMGFTNQALYERPILIIGRVGTHGVVQRWFDKCWPSDNTLVIESDCYEYVFQILRRIDYSSINRGSTQPLITQTDVKGTIVVIPSRNVLQVFEENVSSLMKLHKANTLENSTLATLRDTLLPKLMNGEIEV